MKLIDKVRLLYKIKKPHYFFHVLKTYLNDFHTTYDIELWDLPPYPNSNIEILEILRQLINSPLYVRNAAIKGYLNKLSVKLAVSTSSPKNKEVSNIQTNSRTVV